MKKNLYLLGLLVVLLGGTYIFQELRSEKELKTAFTEGHLVQADQITSLSWGDVDAVKKDKQWWAKDRLLSYNQFKQIEKRIVQIKKIKSISGDKQNFFPDPVSFKVNGEEWVVGDFSLDRQGFYLSKGNEIMLVTSEGESQELSEAPEKVLEIKLDDLKTSLHLSLSSLYENQLFRFYPKLPLGTATIESEGRPSYELDFDKNSTSPPPLAGIPVHDKLLDKFTSLLTQLTIKNEVPYSEALKHSKMGQLIFQNEAEEKVIWELWRSSDKSADSFILDSHRKKAWHMVGGTLKIFFVHHQDYWDKKVIPPSQFKSFSKLKTTFSQGDKSAVMEIVNREPLGFETSKYKVDSEQMNILLQYVFNLSEKDQADRVSQLSKSEKKQLLSEENLRLEIFGQDLIFWRKADEVILVNLTQGFKAHFLVNQQSFRARFEDVLK